MKMVTIPAVETETGSSASAAIATEELQLRIEASSLDETLTSMACDLCVQDVAVEQVFEQLQERAIEQMVAMLDITTFENDHAVDCCMAMIARESEKVAWKALENCTDVLAQGLNILEGTQDFGQPNGYVN